MTAIRSAAARRPTMHSMGNATATGVGRTAGARQPSGPEPATDTEAIVALEQQFAAMFAGVRSQVRDWAAQIHPDLSPAGYNLLACLVRSGPQHANALAAALYMDKSMISRITKHLLELSLLERRPDPHDGRAFFLAATPQASRRVDEVRARRRRELHSYLSEWDVADIRQLTALLSRLNGNR